MGKGPYKMKGSPMHRNFGIGSPIKQTTETTNDTTTTTTISGERKGDHVITKDINISVGTVNSSGTKIINEEGNWTNINSVKGKQLKGKYASTNYADTSVTPSGDVVNVDRTKITKL